MDNAINSIAASTFENFPTFKFKYFPNFKATNENEKLNIENIEQFNKCLLSILFIPIPAIKESILTKNASDNKVTTFKIILSFSSFSNNINIPKKKKMIEDTYLRSINNIFINKSPIIIPSIGIIKWNTPIVIEKYNIFLILIFRVPIHIHKENASKDNAIESRMVVNILSPN